MREFVHFWRPVRSAPPRRGTKISEPLRRLVAHCCANGSCLLGPPPHVKLRTNIQSTASPSIQRAAVCQRSTASFSSQLERANSGRAYTRSPKQPRPSRHPLCLSAPSPSSPLSSPGKTSKLARSDEASHYPGTFSWPTLLLAEQILLDHCATDGVVEVLIPLKSRYCQLAVDAAE